MRPEVRFLPGTFPKGGATGRGCGRRRPSRHRRRVGNRLLLPTGCREVGYPTGFGHRRSQVRVLPARPPTRGRGAAVLASLMSSRSWVRIPPALLEDWLADGWAEEVTEQGPVQSAGPNVQLASRSLQGQPVRRWR